MRLLSSRRYSGVRWALLVIAVVAAVAVTCALIWPVTDLIAAHDVGQIARSVRADHLQSASIAFTAPSLAEIQGMSPGPQASR